MGVEERERERERERNAFREHFAAVMGGRGRRAMKDHKRRDTRDGHCGSSMGG